MSKNLFLILFLACPLSLLAQSTPDFPTSNEISALMQQGNLAMKQFQVTMLNETTKLGKDADAEKSEQQAVENWLFIASVVKPKPDNFNSGVGFMAVDQLNAAYESALACEVNALTNLSAALLAKDEARQNASSDVANDCMNAAQLLAVVKMSATNLYTKYLQAHKVVYDESFSAAVKCGEALKRVMASKQ